MKQRERVAAALRKVADRIDPPTKEKGNPGIILKPVDIESLGGFETPPDRSVAGASGLYLTGQYL